MLLTGWRLSIILLVAHTFSHAIVAAAPAPVPPGGSDTPATVCVELDDQVFGGCDSNDFKGRLGALMCQSFLIH